MSENGKGSNTAKRTNFKLFNERFDLIDWGKKDETAVQELPKDIQDQIDSIKQSIEEQDAILRQAHGKDEAGE